MVEGKTLPFSETKATFVALALKISLMETTGPGHIKNTIQHSKHYLFP
jgi:hypothetical protein